MLAATTNRIIVMINMEIAMQTAQSIDRAAWLNKLALIGYIGSLVVVAILTFLSWWAGSHLQGVIQKDADARIAEADSKAAVANENAGQANERAGVANAEAARANERTEKLENQNLTLRSQVAALETAANDARTQLAEQQGRTATLEKAAADAKAAQQRVETELAQQQERAAKAEKDLLEFKQRFRDRHLSNADRQRITATLVQIFVGRRPNPLISN